ncbi:hypothetical protein N8T08_008769 [Aspergillus melleus]|uniref:Uncharacterized protein n=1 Tax=Aspergillus melleus TaxID=138277 RepID=A0ACC3AV09_9EURO|nr:hypothetical protein N8T08_008769 [Aspergillus melleus]
MFGKHLLVYDLLAWLAWMPLALAAPNRIIARASSSSPVVSYPASLSHGPYSGTPTITGALNATSIGPGISRLGVAPPATTYPSDGHLHDAEPGPYILAGGVRTKGTTPVYNAKSDFDYESLALALYQEYIERDLFHDGLARFSEEDFTAAGLTAEDRYLIQFMVEQEVGHATMLTNILGAKAPKQCNYNYLYTTVQEFIDTSAKSSLASGIRGQSASVLGLDLAGTIHQLLSSRPDPSGLAELPSASYSKPAEPDPHQWEFCIQRDPRRRRHEPFNQLRHPQGPVMSQFHRRRNELQSCHHPQSHAASLSRPGRSVSLTWDAPGAHVGPNNSYVTSSQAREVARLFNRTCRRMLATRPSTGLTVFIAITDSGLYLTPFNLSMINPHVVAGPALYQAG